ncbi:dynein heavy chain [Sugiyamaella lignohabitans]|uniref:Dynein heavy chain n=1 Tax=Sugiyamaella lignohabitans TaxID=796027 RepID=A0A167FIT4_9ASCO|nr:dynein heavy chain [Sugiyamaella lignohabitans]ANB15358.1 dynein heavy chain [Sugiyamaella lignohabitans]
MTEVVGQSTTGIPDSGMLDVELVDPSVVLNYVCNVAKVLLAASDDDLNRSFTDKQRSNSFPKKVCEEFIAEPEATAIFLVKKSIGSSEETQPEIDPEQINLSFFYEIDAKLQQSPDTQAVVAIIKKNGKLRSGIILDGLQLQAIVLPIGAAKSSVQQTVPGDDQDGSIQSSPFEVIHSILHFAVGPYFDAFCKTIQSPSHSVSATIDMTDERSATSVARKKLTELELSIAHLQQNNEVNEVVLPLHPVIEHMLQTAAQESRDPSIDLISSEYLENNQFLTSLQDIAKGWIKPIQVLIDATRDPKTGTAMQEVNFWLSKEIALRNLALFMKSPGVTITLDILYNNNRAGVANRFRVDTPIERTLESVSKYCQLMKDFPLDELVSALTLGDMKLAVIQIFTHLNKKFRGSLYPVSRALALIENISNDLKLALQSLLRERKLMYLDFSAFKEQHVEVTTIFNTWDEHYKEFVNVARDVIRKKGDAFIPIRITAHHAVIKERLDYILDFRAKHDQMYQTLIKVFGKQLKRSVNGDFTEANVEFVDLNPVEEMSLAYDIVKQVDILDISSSKYELAVIGVLG